MYRTGVPLEAARQFLEPLAVVAVVEIDVAADDHERHGVGSGFA
jgi:hypothetical protein